MSRTAFPYRVPGDAVVSAASWQILVMDTPFDLDDNLPDWDYNTDLLLTRVVDVDLDRLRSDTGLPPGAEIALSVVWTASGSSLRAPAFREVLFGNGVQRVAIRSTLRGSDLGGTLTLDTILTLAHDQADVAAFAPRRAGSLLWSDSKSVRLQGDAPQFPIAIIDFASTPYPLEAAWYVQIGTNMHAATMGSLLLLINEANEPASTAFKNASSPRPVDVAIISSTYADVARTLIEHALSNAEFDDVTSYPEDSLGATLQAMIQMRFPDEAFEDLRRQRDNSPTAFSTRVQASVKIFEELS
ncbi:hypothetical protein [Rhodococcus tukisamuensis]|uniref:Uncharacterized protein n=1 Tax=Rhodococcus tukisamuensis TaxID=168276 RepID=A0A1G7B6B1_9NOCA|nr:hypothetical protein [Rhodococcus tukisamuensis]SDE22543.1 hypothetical protein SAMN05444580_11293 [Rhodococcus tukisamuensis]